jgi:hypothetical protein
MGAVKNAEAPTSETEFSLMISLGGDKLWRFRKRDSKYLVERECWGCCGRRARKAWWDQEVGEPSWSI